MAASPSAKRLLERSSTALSGAGGGALGLLLLLFLDGRLTFLEGLAAAAIYLAASWIHHRRNPEVRTEELEAEVRRRLRQAGTQLVRATNIDQDAKRQVLELFEAFVGEEGTDGAQAPRLRRRP